MQSTVYLEDYVDTIESLPMELSRYFGLMRDLDAMAQDVVTKVETQISEFIDQSPSLTPEDRVKKIQSICLTLKETLRHGEDKAALASQTYDMVDRHIQRLDEDLERFHEEQLTGPKIVGSSTRVVGRDDYPHSHTSLPQPSHHIPSRIPPTSVIKPPYPSVEKPSTSARSSNNPDQSSPAGGRRGGNPPGVVSNVPSRPTATPTRNSRPDRAIGNKKRNIKEKDDQLKPKGPNPTSVSTPGGSTFHDIDPNEPRYCMCGQVSFGEMIACDNPDCEIEWFHFHCVGLNQQPKGKWFCPDCSRKMKRK